MAEKSGVDAIVHTEDPNGNFDRSWREERWGDKKLSVAAQDVTNEEKDMTTLEALKIYKKAIMWCLIISTCVIMEVRMMTAAKSIWPCGVVADCSLSGI